MVLHRGAGVSCARLVRVAHPDVARLFSVGALDFYRGADVRASVVLGEIETSCATRVAAWFCFTRILLLACWEWTSMTKLPNHITAPNAGIAPRFQCETHWPGIDEFCRYRLGGFHAP
jgi:hypothetical protein